MKATFLGTGTSGGVPLVGCNCLVCTSVDTKDKRLRCSLLIEHKNDSILIDAGPDFRFQMLREKIQKLSAILLTHGHRDHIAGLDDTRSLTYMTQQPMPIYADAICIKMVHEMYSYVFSNRNYPGIPELNLIEFSESKFSIGNIEIEPIQVMHYKLPIFGFRIGRLAYITDANFIDTKQLAKLKNLDYLVINALRKTDHISHYKLSEALEVIEKVQPKKAFITHVSHQMGLHAQINTELPASVELAYDGLTIEF